MSCLAVAPAVGLAACGSSGGGGGGGGGGTASGTNLTIYSSLPLQGASRTQSEAVVNGEKLALQQAGGKAGKFKLKLVSLDDSTASAGKWDPSQVAVDARKAVGDKSTIAYIGEFNSGASAISIPILNQAGIGQVSPANTAVGLTVGGAGATPGEPQKYYPTGKRTYTRVVPRDTIQAAAQAQLQKAQGCTKTFVLNDKEVYGAGLATNFVLAAKSAGVKVAGNQGWDPKAPNYRSQAAAIKGTGADCVLISGITDNNAVQLAKDVATANPTAKIFGPDGISDAGFYDPKQGGIPLTLDSRTFVTQATLSPASYGPAGKQFLTAYDKTFSVKSPDVYSFYGYTAMQVALNAIKRAGAQGASRPAVIKALFSTKNLPTVIGTFSITKNGDTTTTNYGSYKVVKGALVFFKELKPTA